MEAISGTKFYYVEAFLPSFPFKNREALKAVERGDYESGAKSHSNDKLYHDCHKNDQHTRVIRGK